MKNLNYLLAIAGGAIAGAAAGLLFAPNDGCHTRKGLKRLLCSKCLCHQCGTSNETDDEPTEETKN